MTGVFFAAGGAARAATPGRRPQRGRAERRAGKSAISLCVEDAVSVLKSCFAGVLFLFSLSVCLSGLMD